MWGTRLLQCSTCPPGGAATPRSQPHRVFPSRSLPASQGLGRKCEPRGLPGLLQGMLLFFSVHKRQRAKKTCLLTGGLLSDLLTLPAALNFSSSRASLPYLLILHTPTIRPPGSWFSCLPSLLTGFLPPSPHPHAHVQFATFSPCSRLLQMPAALLSLISTIKSSPHASLGGLGPQFITNSC